MLLVTMYNCLRLFYMDINNMHINNVYNEVRVCKLVRFQIFTLAMVFFFNSKIYGFVWMGQLEGNNGFVKWDLKLFAIINEPSMFVDLKTHVDGELTLFVYSHVVKILHIFNLKLSVKWNHLRI